MTDGIDRIDAILNRVAAERGPNGVPKSARVGPGTFAAINRGDRAVGMPVRYRGVAFSPDPNVPEGAVRFDGDPEPTR